VPLSSAKGDLARLSRQLLHRSGNVFNGHVPIDAVQIQQIDAVDAQPPKLRVDH
jgi:hypothetical protein